MVIALLGDNSILAGLITPIVVLVSHRSCRHSAGEISEICAVSEISCGAEPFNGQSIDCKRYPRESTCTRALPAMLLESRQV
jgi:hypothetical protein